MSVHASNSVQNFIILQRYGTRIHRNFPPSLKGTAGSHYDILHYVESIKETVPASRCQLFHDQFRRSVTGYNILELSHMPAETFIYDWYAKNLGQIKSTGVTLNSSK